MVGCRDTPRLGLGRIMGRRRSAHVRPMNGAPARSFGFELNADCSHFPKEFGSFASNTGKRRGISPTDASSLTRTVRSNATINVSALEAMSAAKATVTDMGSFCGRQPDACSVGSQAAVAIGHRAQAGAKMLYDYFNEHFGSQDAGTTANAANGTALPLPTPRPSQHTLSPADLAPGWRGPQSRKETRSDRPT